MAKRTKKSKYGIGSLLLLLAFAFYIGFVKDSDKPVPDKPIIDKPEKKIRKAKKERPLRYLTVFEGKVIGIKDGDTFEVLYDSIPERVRLAEIDCPEKSQPFGKNARQYASELCFGKTVTVTSSGKRDRYKRVVGTITTAEGINVNEELVKAGLAWHYEQYSDNDELSLIEAEARQAKRGLWADKDPMAPWDWRKQKRKKSSPSKEVNRPLQKRPWH